MNAEEWGEQFEAMAKTAGPGELPPNWGVVGLKAMPLLSDASFREITIDPPWQLFFAE